MKFKIIYVAILGVGFISSTAIVSERLSNESEFTIICNSMVIKGKSQPKKQKIVAKNGHVQLAGRVSKVIELSRDNDLDSNNYYSFNLFSEYEHMETCDSFLLDASGNLTWEVADINTSRNILSSVNVFEFKDCLSLGLN